MMASYRVGVALSLDWQVDAEWQPPDTSFMQLAFWQALQASQAIGEGSDWFSVYLTAHTGNKLVAVLPVFVKQHHQGEYVFDHAWAQAYARLGRAYYPRLVTSVPFTPVTGQRLWLAMGQQLDAALWQAFSRAIDDLAAATSASTWHGLFIDAKLLQFGTQQGNLTRLGCQFMWFNRNQAGDKFTDFAEFLSTLTAKKRKSIRVERQKIVQQGLDVQVKCGEQLSEADWQVFYQCYAMTYLVRGRQPYLSLTFFEQIAASMPANLLMVQGVEASGAVVACALFFYDKTTLYGRYWGCLAEYDSLHFELCYYQGIAFAIAQGLERFDPGTQGEHKLIRGFVPVFTHSLHRVYDERFLPAIANFCQQETQAVQAYHAEAMTALPFNASYLASLLNVPAKESSPYF